MELKDLVKKAMNESPRFREKYQWRVQTRNKAPDLNWLMRELEMALGREFVENAANLQIAKAEQENAKQGN
jgi:hypothetical protein